MKCFYHKMTQNLTNYTLKHPDVESVEQKEVSALN